jgi:hypothetical protein
MGHSGPVKGCNGIAFNFSRYMWTAHFNFDAWVCRKLWLNFLLLVTRCREFVG